MPTIIIGTPQKNITVRNSVVREVLQQIKEQTHFPRTAELVIDNAEQGEHRKLQSNVDREDDPVRFQYDDYIFATVREEFTPEGVVFDTHYQQTHKPLFLDQPVGVKVTPIYSEVMVTMDLRFRARDLSALTAWRNLLRTANGIQNLVTRHNVRYDYEVPHSILSLVYDVWTMKEAVGGTGISFKDYLKKHFVEGLTTRSNQSGSHSDVIINEYQQGIVGQAQQELFYNEREAGEGIYEVPVSYRFKYRQITSLRVHFPAHIHNQEIPEKYLEAWCPLLLSEPEKGVYTYGHTQPLVLDERVPRVFRGDGGTRLIPWDEWFPDGCRDDTQTLSIIPIVLDHTNTSSSINLNDIPDDLLPEGVLEVLRLFHAGNGEYGKAIIGCDLYSIGETEHRVAVEIDPALNMSVPYQLDVKLRYYLRIYIHKDLSKVLAVSHMELNKYPDAALAVYRILDSELTASPVEGEGDLYITPGNTIGDFSFMSWLVGLSDTPYAIKRMKNRFPKHVSVMDLSTWRAR